MEESTLKGGGSLFVSDNRQHMETWNLQDQV